MNTISIRRIRSRLACIMISAMLVLNGCGYPEVSPQTYQIANALYSACNRESEEQLAKVSLLIEESLTETKLTKQEARWLNDIVERANAGDWEAAALETRQLIQDQAHEQ